MTQIDRMMRKVGEKGSHLRIRKRDRHVIRLTEEMLANDNRRR